MTNPFSLVPYALAATKGTIGGVSTNTLVAAGLTLLQRSAALVRALSSVRPALLLPPGAASLVALAACDGHVALIVDHGVDDTVLAEQFKDARVGVVFTLATFRHRVPPDVMIVLLDDVPARARVLTDGTERAIDLGSHVGLRLEGLAEATGSDVAVVSWFVDGTEISVSHAETLSGVGPLSWLCDTVRQAHGMP